MGRKCIRVKNEIVVGHHPVEPWWKPYKNYLSVLGYGSLGSLQPGACRGAEHWRKACLCLPPLARKHHPGFPSRRADPYLLEFNLINILYIKTPVMSRKVSFEERKVISVVRASRPEVLWVAGSSSASLRGVSSVGAILFLPG